MPVFHNHRKEEKKARFDSSTSCSDDKLHRKVGQKRSIADIECDDPEERKQMQGLKRSKVCKNTPS